MSSNTTTLVLDFLYDFPLSPVMFEPRLEIELPYLASPYIPMKGRLLQCNGSGHLHVGGLPILIHHIFLLMNA